jgi:hypothetical protein
MTRPFRPIAASLATFTCCAVALAAQQPRITNGQVTAQPAGTPFVRTVESLVSAQPEITWIGYAVPVSDDERVMCCVGNSYISGSVVTSDGACCGACRLEPGGEGTTTVTARSGAPGGPVKLEGSDRMVVLLRVVARRVERVRVFSEECQLDAGGRPVRWIDNVRPADSIALLESLVGAETDRRDRVTGGALSALSMHAEPSATDALVRLARTHAAPGVRGDALFWLAQRAGQKAAALITERIDQDPDTDVKKRAVFALSQLPKDEGVPLLIKVARTNTNPAVRKQAMFWLGQSRDPRAIDFFAEILSK